MLPFPLGYSYNNKTDEKLCLVLIWLNVSEAVACSLLITLSIILSNTCSCKRFIWQEL